MAEPKKFMSATAKAFGARGHADCEQPRALRPKPCPPQRRSPLPPAASPSPPGICAAAGAAFGVLGAAAFGPSVSSVVITMLGETARARGANAPRPGRSFSLPTPSQRLARARRPTPFTPTLTAQGIATTVKLLLCVNLMLTFPIVCRSAFLIIEGLFERGGKALSGLQQKALRSAFVVAATVLATSVPSFGALLSLVGGVSLSVITLVFPSAIALFGKDAKGGSLVPMGGLERAFAALVGLVGLGIVGFTLAVR